MEKEFNIFGEFDSIENQYLQSLATGDEKVEPDVDEEDTDDEEELDKLIEEKKKAAVEASKEGEDDEGDEDEDEEVTDPKDKSDDNEDSDEDNGNYSFKALASVLAEEGVIDYEDSEDEEDSVDIISKAVLTTAKNLLEDYKQSLPEDGQKFLKYLEKGGDPSKYIDQTSNKSILDLDIEDEDNQKIILKEFLKRSNFDEDEIEEMIEDYDSGLILEKQAKIALKKLNKMYDKDQEDLVVKQEKLEQDRQDAYQKQIKELEDTIEVSDDIAGIKISKADKRALKSYLLAADKEGKTQWSKDLQDGGIKTQLALAYLQMKKFNFESIAKEATTTVTRKYKNIFDRKDQTVKGRSKKVETDDKGDLSAFKSFLA